MKPTFGQIVVYKDFYGGTHPAIINRVTLPVDGGDTKPARGTGDMIPAVVKSSDKSAAEWAQNNQEAVEEADAAADPQGIKRPSATLPRPTKSAPEGSVDLFVFAAEGHTGVQKDITYGFGKNQWHALTDTPPEEGKINAAAVKVGEAHDKIQKMSKEVDHVTALHKDGKADTQALDKAEADLSAAHVEARKAEADLKATKEGKPLPSAKGPAQAGDDARLAQEANQARVDSAKAALDADPKNPAKVKEMDEASAALASSKAPAAV